MKVLRVGDVMKREFDRMEGMTTVKDALLKLKHPEARAILIEKRNAEDEFGMVLLSDIAKKVLGADRAPERVSLYEIMAKPVLSVKPDMQLKYCARLLERFSIMRAPVIEGGEVVGIVSYHDLVLEGMLQMIRGEEKG